MIIPDGKDYLVYVKTAKTGGTSFIEVLKQISNKCNVNYLKFDELDNAKKGDIIMIVNDQLIFFKERYTYIFDNAYFIMISRNPYTRLLSGWKYHPTTKNKTLESLILSPIYPPKKPYDIEWKKNMPRNTWDLFSMYNHFYCTQTETLIFDDVFIVDHILIFEDLNNEINKFLKHIQVDDSIEIPHLNKSQSNNINISYFNNKKTIVNEINNLFDDDFRLLGYNKLE